MKKSLLFLPFLGLLLIITPILSQEQEQQAADTAKIYLPLILKPEAQEPPGSHAVYLPTIIKSPPPTPDPTYDIAQFLAREMGNGTIYEVQHSSGSQARHQTQAEPTRFYHTKGEPIAEWEELWATNDYIYRGTDTSPGDANSDGRPDYYSLRENGQYGSKWAPRFWRVGEVFERNPIVTFYSKDNCSEWHSGTSQTWLKFEAYYDQYTFTSGITLNHVVKLAWLLAPNAAPTESYFYAEGYGLVGWESNDGHGFSYISEIHAPGQRPDNTRETISCLNTSAWSRDRILEKLLPLPPDLARHVK